MPVFLSLPSTLGWNLFRGYDVDFVTEATATFPIALPDGGELSTDEVVRRTEAVLRNRFARIAKVDELVGELKKAALPCNG